MIVKKMRKWDTLRKPNETKHCSFLSIWTIMWRAIAQYVCLMPSLIL